ncbi:L-tyrosine 3-hydroxylase [Nocardia sp. CDC159]|uniref:L-tyrosine 3-hydroxylase n=1 Tax=Nocardia pulmonis TaxID=2951408 RepID=A0A9X2ED56_9NOCA|nr:MULTISPECIES: L-tyrosine 3-hydroxylase [Nocardia]MCM6778279.1 L-tyrosine 3-hydroxylase [Nocardia pulmonis]MCM6791168.1 L-tyrosine 3-hydroxylase [Nocardia sp. CDC159]
MSSDHPPVLLTRLLFMPRTGQPYAPSPELDRDAAEQRDLPEYDILGDRPVQAQPLFWYRWIAGHQISFVLWRAMHDILGRHPDGVPDERELDVLAACVDGYSAMLLYSSTVPREHYHAHTRVRMALQHPSFSGAWAPDYRPIRRLFRGRFPWQGDPVCAALDEAVTRNGVTHDHIADHLVPDGRSLLQQSAGAPGVSVSREKEDLYDNFFLTVRRPVSHAELVAQLDSRLTELAADLRHNGLYPRVEGRHYPVVPEQSTVLRPLVTGVLRVTDRAARLVSALRLEDVRR